MRKPADEVALPPLSILLVDGDGYTLSALAGYLPSPPLHVALALNGRAALESVMADLPDVVVMDIDMPLVGGYEAAARMRAWEASEGYGRRVLIAMSAHNDPLAGPRCLEAGFDRFLVKPVRGEDLHTALAALSHPAADHIVKVDAELAGVLPGFLSSRRSLAEELSLAVTAGQAEKARAAAHKLAGGFGLYGFAWAAGQSRMIELRARDGSLDGLPQEVAALRRHLDTVRVELRRRREEETP